MSETNTPVVAQAEIGPIPITPSSIATTSIIIGGKVMDDVEVIEEFIEIEAQPVLLMRDFVRMEMNNKVFKDISYQDFLSIISEAADVTASKSSIGFQLPSGCFYTSISGDILEISSYYPEAIKPFQYLDSNHNTEKFNIVTPNIIISYKLKRDKNGEWVLQNSFYLVTDLPVNKLPIEFLKSQSYTKRLFLMPFTNAYADCKMCFGGNRMPVRFPADNLRGLDYYYSFLWDTPFNNDLGIHDKVRNFTVRDWYYMLRDLAKVPGNKFPYEKLGRS